MIAVDTNVLVYAHRRDFPGHTTARECLYRLAEGSRLWSIPVFSLAEFLRVVTHRRLFNPPSTLEEATGAVEALLQSPTLTILVPGPNYPHILLQTCREADTRGNLVFDSQIAALCRQDGVRRILTLDRDFSRFPDLDLLSPEDFV